MVNPVIESLFGNGIVTCFAYGQTGSGKTFTMKGVQSSSIRDIFNLANTKYAEEEASFTISFFEIYGGKLFDLLNNKKKLIVQEDYNNKIQIPGLMNKEVTNEEEMLKIIEYGNSVRVTHATQANDESSRSHAICQLNIYSQARRGAKLGQMMLVDLAGSERGQDTNSNNRVRRLEGAEINKSLLALKECIRAFDSKKKGKNSVHVPFRASKLTMVLRDSFISKSKAVKIIMVACVGPSSYCSDHTMNTLRYAGRLKTSFVQGVSANSNRKALPPIYKPQVRKHAKDDFEALDHIAKNAPDAGPKPPKPVSSKNKKGKPITSGRGRHTPSSYQGKNALAQAGARILENGSLTNLENGRPVSSRRSPQKEEQKKLEDLRMPDQKEGEKQDLNYLQATMKGDLAAEFLSLAAKADNVVEEQEEFFEAHELAMRQHNKLINREKDMLQKAQSLSEEDEIEDYVEGLELILKRRRELDDLLLERLAVYKSKLKEEEEEHFRVTQGLASRGK